MGMEVVAQFDHASTVATFIGESVGTHYSAALRAAEAYGKYLSAVRESLLLENFRGDGLGHFWRDLMRAEQVQGASSTVLVTLSTKPSYYFSDFLDTADAVFGRKYQDVSEQQKKKIGQTEHAQCLRLLRDHNAAGMKDHFAVQNKVAGWMQMMRLMGTYRH